MKFSVHINQKKKEKLIGFAIPIVQAQPSTFK